MRKANDILYRIEDQLGALGFTHMASTLDELYHSKDFLEMNHLSVISAMVEAEYEERIARRFRTHMRTAHLTGCPQEIEQCKDSNVREYLPRDITSTLASLEFIHEGLNVCILGPSDSGKSYLAKALAIKACYDFKVAYYHCQSLLEEMVSLKQVDYPKYQRRMKRLNKCELLVLDDFLLHSISEEQEMKVLYELLEKRSELSRSTIVCSQREPKSWKSMMLNDEVSANAIVKRATKHYTVVINLKTK